MVWNSQYWRVKYVSKCFLFDLHWTWNNLQKDWFVVFVLALTPKSNYSIIRSLPRKFGSLLASWSSVSSQNSFAGFGRNYTSVFQPSLGKYLITSLDLLNDEGVTVTRKSITRHHTTVNINYFKLCLARDILCRRNLLVFRMWGLQIEYLKQYGSTVPLGFGFFEGFWY